MKPINIVLPSAGDSQHGGLTSHNMMKTAIENKNLNFKCSATSSFLRNLDFYKLFDTSASKCTRRIVGSKTLKQRVKPSPVQGDATPTSSSEMATETLTESR